MAMKTLITMFLIVCASSFCRSQSIVGRWQLVKQSSCVEDQLGEEEDSEIQALVEDLKGMSGASSQILEFKENNTGHESTKIISKKKSYNSKSFLYRYDKDGLYFLDKKSRTIIEGYTVEKLESDSLIITNSSRVCETKVFVRVR